MPFRDQLRDLLRKEPTFPAELLSVLPSGFQQLESRAIVRLKPPLEPYSQIIAAAIHQLLPKITAVWNRGEIEGEFRQPMDLLHLWGDPSTELIVTENNVRYKFDFTRIMFAKGNIYERGLLPQKIQPGEIIVDMFAGIGYFTLGMAKTKKPRKIYSIEWNPESFKYLQENIRLNRVESVVEPIFGDCKQRVPELAKKGILADRIIMGLLPAPEDAIPAALSAIKDSGTIVLYEGVEPKESSLLFDQFSTVARPKGLQTSLLERRIVKNYKPHLYHVVVEIFVKK